MRRRVRFALPLLLCASAWAHAATVRDVRIEGIGEPELAHNAMLSLSLARARSAHAGQVSEERLAFLLRRAPEEIRAALEPYGYYDASVAADVRREGDAATIVFTVRLGAPVRVASQHVEVRGEAGKDEAVTRMSARFRPRQGQILDHRKYEASKLDVERRLAARGYFDQVLARHRVEVTRATHAATIEVAWDSGPRYRFGATTFGPSQLRPGLLDPLLRWKPGEPYDEGHLVELQQALADLDYFGVVDVSPDLEHRDGGQVPIDVATTPAKRNVYSAGLSYGTDSGMGATLGFDRRWINRGGHKFSSQLEWAQNRKLLAAQYKIPAFAWLDGWYALSARAIDEQTDAGHTRLAELVGSRVGRIGRWNLTAAMHVQRERYEDASFPDLDRYATLVFPSLSVQTSRGNNKLYPSRGWGLLADASGGSTAIGSDVDFLHLHARLNWVHGFGNRNRVLLRGELGHVFTGRFSELPPSLRYFAGGDTSVRGYGYQEIGPRVNGQNVGAPNLAVVSAEFEHRFNQAWGGAVFADDGDAFDHAPRSHLGIGVGLRWRSPVGPVRIDIAHGFNDARSPVHLHLNIGSDL